MTDIDHEAQLGAADELADANQTTYNEPKSLLQIVAHPE